LQGDRQPAFEGVLRAEQLLDRIVEIDATSLELGADRIVDAISRSMFDLVSQFEEES